MSIRVSITAERSGARHRPRWPYGLRSWRRFRRHRAATAGLLLLLALSGLALAAPALTPEDPEGQDLGRALAPASRLPPLGPDHLVRDLMAGLPSGGRLTLLMGFLPDVCGLSVGVPSGEF